MLGRQLLDGVVVLHSSEKMDGILFKIDFEKVYDKIKCFFLQQTLRMKGFVPE
jgi:hypothetical protein